VVQAGSLVLASIVADALGTDLETLRRINAVILRRQARATSTRQS